jgi:6-phosphofructokinase 1
MKKTILVLTGGGLASALNATLYGIISEAQNKNFRVLGGVEGWNCFTAEGKIIDLSNVNVDPLQKHGGTFLRSSRANPIKQDGGVDILREVIKKEKIDSIIAIGGDDTMGATKELFEKYDIDIVGVPKTVDNDLFDTYWSPGFPTAATKINQITRQIREEAAYSLKRVFLIETIGRSAGWIPASSCLANPDLILVPEKKISYNSFLEKIEQKYKQNNNYATVVMAEEVNFDIDIDGVVDNQSDHYGNNTRKSFISIKLREKIMKELGIYTQVVIPRNFLQTGVPVDIDKDMAIKLGQNAVQMVTDEKFGMMSAIIRPDELKGEFEVSSVKLDGVVDENNYFCLDDTWFDFDNFSVKDKFKNYISSFVEDPESCPEYHKLLKKVLNN